MVEQMRQHIEQEGKAIEFVRSTGLETMSGQFPRLSAGPLRELRQNAWHHYLPLSFARYF
jgi:hypothetical protein